MTPVENSTSPPAILLENVTKVFRSQGRPLAAVDDVSLEIPRGTVVAFLGPNGAGKTTTLDMVLGLTAPTQGRIEVLGQNARDAVRSGKISAVLQSGGLLRDLTVGETVELIASTFDDAISTEEALTRAGISGLAKRRVSKCSGGEQQRLRFALALLPDPDLLILDEPTTGMDVTARHEFWDTMHAEARRGRTIIFATHYLEEADSFAERIVMISGGKIVADGTTREIRSHVAGRIVSARISGDGGTSQVPPLAQAAAALEARNDVHTVHTEGDRLVVHAGDSDAVALALLTQYGGEDLEVTSGSLDEAFTALTRHDTELRHGSEVAAREEGARK